MFLGRIAFKIFYFEYLVLDDGSLLLLDLLVEFLVEGFAFLDRQVLE